MTSVNLIIPTRNESENIAKLLPQIMPYGYEVVVVDDSTDDTAAVAESLGARVIKGRGLGLAQAVLDGIKQTDKDCVIVMDADCLPFGTSILVPKRKQVGMRLSKYGKEVQPYSISYIGTERIENLKIGDLVLSYNEQTGVKESDEVSALFRRHDKRLVKLKCSNRNELTLTGNHPIFVHGKGWVKADDIQVGDKVVQCKSNGITLRLWNITKRNRTYEQIHGELKAKEYREKVRVASVRNNSLNKEKISNGHKRIWANKNSGYYTSEKYKKHMREATLSLNDFNRKQKGKTYEERYGNELGKYLRDLRARNIGLSNSPNRSEMFLMGIINEVCPGEFKYNGCCELGIVINHHVPDFWNVNGKKKVIELFGATWHPTSDEAKYKMDYGECGVDCLVIWASALRNQRVLKQKILDFLYNPNAVVVTVVGKEGIVNKDGFDTYNLETKKNHNFFAHGILVHNCQHPPSLLPEVVKKLNYYDLVTVTKHNKESEAELSQWRKLQSNLGVWTAQALIPAPVSDPMTGFFGVRRKCLDGVELEAIGFKIGLEIIAKAKWVSHYDLPMKFGKREFGKSKGTAHSLQKHIYRLFQYHLEHKAELPKGSEEYYNFYEGNDWQQSWKQGIALVLQDITRGIKPQNLLDCGSGSSPNIGYMHGREKVGMDIRKEALDYMRSHADAVFVEGSVLDIPFGEASFDVVTCIEVLEHLYPDEVSKALSEIGRVLRPDGYAILATPNYASPLWNIVEAAQQFLQPGKWTSDHHTKFNRQSLRDLCSGYGLKEVRYDGVMRNMDMIVTYKKGGDDEIIS